MKESKKYLFKQAALLGRGQAGVPGGHGHFYSTGVHALVDAKHAETPTFKHFAKHGLIVEHIDEEPKVLAKAKHAGAMAASKEAAMQPDAEVGGEAEVEAEAEVQPEAEIGGEEEPEHKGGKHHKRRK